MGLMIAVHVEDVNIHIYHKLYPIGLSEEESLCVSAIRHSYICEIGVSVAFLRQ
jgi:hypothetical protein